MVFHILFTLHHTAGAQDIYVDTNYKKGIVVGNKARPYRKLKKHFFKSNNRIFIKANSIIRTAINLHGLSNFALSSYGDGMPPVINMDNNYNYGIKVLSSKNIKISNIHIRNTNNSCIHIIGTDNFEINSVDCKYYLYVIQVNDGKHPSSGEIISSSISHVQGDGIGAWSLTKGLTIKNNNVSMFGNDGIDILGSFRSIIDNNIVHDSIDIESNHSITISAKRGITHAGIKAGGNKSNGGGWNIITNNTVYNVKNFGIYNRHAVSNIYESNKCFNNGVNFNFVKSDGPSWATIIDNISYSATYEGGLEYDVFIPQQQELIFADNNRWINPRINILNYGIVTNINDYKRIMAPQELNTTFD